MYVMYVSMYVDVFVLMHVQLYVYKYTACVCTKTDVAEYASTNTQVSMYVM